LGDGNGFGVKIGAAGAREAEEFEAGSPALGTGGGITTLGATLLEGLLS
jgi:hypothetical protein